MPASADLELGFDVIGFLQEASAVCPNSTLESPHSLQDLILGVDAQLPPEFEILN